MANILIINGTDLSDKVMSYKFSKKELDLDSGRNLEGVMERNILPHHARTLDIVFPPCDGSTMSNILAVLDNPNLIVTAFDPVAGGEQSNIHMYHGDLNPEILIATANNPNDWLWNTLTVQLVEY